MVRIQTPAGYIEVKKDTACPITYSSSDIRDLSKRTGNKSKTITAVGTDENNRILGMLFDVNATYDAFNINAITECQVLEDDVPVMQDAVLQLVSVEKVQKTIEEDDEIVYSLLVKSKESDLFTAMDNKELTELDFSEMNHVYNAANVVGSFDNTVTEGYVYTMGVNDDADFTIQDFRPGIYLKRYYDKIHATNGFSYEVQGVPFFDKLYIPYNGDDALGNFLSYEVEATKASFNDANSTITGWTEILDDESIFNPTTGQLTVPFYIGNGQGMIVTLSFDLDIVLTNNEAVDAYLVNGAPGVMNPNVSLQYMARIGIYKNGQFVAWQNLASQFRSSSDPGIVPGDNTIGSLTATVDMPISNLQAGDVITFRLVSVINPGMGNPNFIAWRIGTSPNDLLADVDFRIDMNTLTMNTVFTTNSVGFGQTLDMNLFIPRKVKQKDLIKSVTTALFLMAVPDEDNPNKIIYIPRDVWYDNGNAVDWSTKMAKDRPQNVQFIPELSAKKLQLSYKPDKDSYNEGYEKTVGEVYGQVEFTFDNEFVKGIDRKELIFSPTPTIELNIGAVVPAIVGAAPKNNIRLLIHNGQLSCNAYNIYDYGTTGQTGVTVYPNCGHFDHPYNPTVDINFAVCDYYFCENIVLTNNNLFNMFWRRVASQINSGKMLTAEFDLSPYDIAKMRLNDKIWLGDSWWNINQVMDYDANSNRLTKVELISVDDYIDLPAFRVKNPRPIGWTSDYFAPLLEQHYDKKNLNLSQGGVTVNGKGNIIGQNLKGLVLGGGLTALNQADLPPVPFEPLEQNCECVLEFITYSDLSALVSNEELDPGKQYLITDKGIKVTAIGESLLASTAERYMRIVKNTYYTPSGTTLGVWHAGLSPSASDIAIWGGKVWSNNSGVNGAYVDPETLNSNWDAISEADDTYYFTKAFGCVYDFANDWVSRQWDDRNNVLGAEYSMVFTNYLHICDWGNENIYNNRSQYIYNNANGINLISDNIVLRGIYENANAGDISANIMNGQITANTNNGAIQDNIGVVNIAGNDNNGYISKNRNNGSISGIGSANTDITQNINNGDIVTTTTGVINDTVVNK